MRFLRAGWQAPIRFLAPLSVVDRVVVIGGCLSGFVIGLIFSGMHP